MIDLFRAKAPANAVVISSAAGQAGLSKAQKAFNTLIKKIDARRSELAAWEAAIPSYQQTFTERLLPLRESLVVQQVRLVTLLDSSSLQKGLTKTERTKISDLIVHLVAPLMEDSADDKLNAIYERHAPVENEGDKAARAHDAALMRAQLNEEFGLDLGEDFDPGSATPEDLLRHLHAQAQRDNEAREARRAARKKSKKQLENEARVEAEEKDVSQAIREVFRKLVSALHPDREPDPDERARKTALMQRVNQAYERRNLLQLLELQLELEHIDAAALASLSESRLVHFNKVLKEQLAELEMELLATEDRFRHQFDLFDVPVLVPAVLPRLIEIDIIRLRRTVDSMEAEFAVFADKATLKAWLKDIRRELAAETRRARDPFSFGPPPF